MNKMNLLFLILLFPFIVLIRLFTPNKDRRGRKLTDTIERKYPKCKIINIKMQYDEQPSAISTGDKAKKVKGAVAVIESNGERRTLQLSYADDIWNIDHDSPDSGNDIH